MYTFGTIVGATLTVLVIVALVVIAGAGGTKKPKEVQREIQVFLHNRAFTFKLNTQSPYFKTLLSTSEEALTSAAKIGRMLRLMVSRKDIERIKSREVSIEIVYPEIKEFQFQIKLEDIKKASPWLDVSKLSTEDLKKTKTLKWDRLLIPLTGQFAQATHPKTKKEEKYVTIFYGVRGYGHGPYTNSEEFQDKIRKLLKDMEYIVE